MSILTKYCVSRMDTKNVMIPRNFNRKRVYTNNIHFKIVKDIIIYVYKYFIPQRRVSKS